MQKLLSLLFCWAFCGLLSAQHSFTTYPNDPLGVKTTELANGLKVYLVEDHNRPLIYGGVVVKAGGKYDPKDATGMGHYLEHMLFKGTQTMGTTDYAKEKVHLDRIDSLYEVLGATTEPEARAAVQKAINDQAVRAAEYAIPNEMDRLLSAIGGTGVNAFTQEEMIMYHNSFPPNQVEKWLDIYAHRFEKPVFRLFQSELETVYEEKNRAMDNFTYALIKRFSDGLFKNHPYGQQDIIGETDHLKNPSLIKMYAYFEQYYVANNMALVLSGDFDAETVMPMIEAKFGKLKRGDVPSYPEYPEQPFDGRELIKGRYTPIGAGLVGFRTVPVGHADESALEVVNYMLSNEGQTGLLDQLMLDQRLMIAQMITMNYIDHGATMLIVVPKLIGQSVKKAEAIVMTELKKLRDGDFEDWRLNAAKTNLNKEFQESLEGLSSRAMFLANAFIEDRTWADYLRYPQEVDAVTRERVMAVADKYYNDDYLILHSRMGFPKKQKLAKPGFEPPIPKAEVKSEYAKYFGTLPEQPPKANFVDFDKDIATVRIADQVALHCVENPLNDVFNLDIRFKIGTYTDKRYEYAAEYMNLVGTESMSLAEVKRAFNNVGCMYNFSAEDNFVTVTLEGFEKDLVDGLKMLSDVIANAQPDQSKVGILLRGEKTNRKLEAKDVQTIGRGFYNYALYGKRSPEASRMTLKEIKALQATELIALFRQATGYGCEIHYSGRQSAETVAEALKKHFFKEKYPEKAGTYVYLPRVKYAEPTVLFLDRKDALQTQLFFYQEGRPQDMDGRAVIDAFNEYFGAGMSALVFQEIREFRSLAYSARAFLAAPREPGSNAWLWGYIGCQADKTMEAIEVMTDLIRNMPQKSQRMPSLKKAIQQSAYTKRPGFRNLSQTVTAWQRMGFDGDPSAAKVARYAELEFEDLYAFYKAEIQAGEQEGRPLVLVLTGDSKRIDMEGLRKYGKLVMVEQDEALRK